MRAAVCSAYGPPEALKLADVQDPTPKAGEVRIRIRATAVTSSDCHLRGLDLSPAYRVLARVALGWRAPRQPILGMVLAGEVDAVGSAVTRFAKGDAVIGFDRRRFGTYAQYVCWPQDALLTSRPANLTNEEAAAIPYGGYWLSTSCVEQALRPGNRFSSTEPQALSEPRPCSLRPPSEPTS